MTNYKEGYEIRREYLDLAKEIGIDWEESVHMINENSKGIFGNVIPLYLNEVMIEMKEAGIKNATRKNVEEKTKLLIQKSICNTFDRLYLI